MLSNQVIPFTEEEQSAKINEFNMAHGSANHIPLVFRNFKSGWPLLQVSLYTPHVDENTGKFKYIPMLGGGKCHALHIAAYNFARLLSQVPGSTTSQPDNLNIENLNQIIDGYEFEHRKFKIRIEDKKNAYGKLLSINLPIGLGDSKKFSSHFAELLNFCTNPGQHLAELGDYNNSIGHSARVIKARLNSEYAIFVNGQVFMDFGAAVQALNDEDVTEFFKAIFRVDEFLELKQDENFKPSAESIELMEKEEKDVQVDNPKKKKNRIDYQALFKTLTLDTPLEVKVEEAAPSEPVSKPIALSATSKKAFIIELKNILDNQKPSRQQILDLFEELKIKNGKYYLIHQQSHSCLQFHWLRLFFKSKVNPGESEKNFWHTKLYQEAVKMLKDAYLKAEADPEIDKVKEKNFIDYFRGNSCIHKKFTGTHLKFFSAPANKQMTIMPVKNNSVRPEGI